VPSGVETNTSHLVLIRRGATRSQPVRVSVAPAQPGAFTTDGLRAIAVVARGSQQFVASLSQPARAGDVLVLYCSGLGEVTPAVEAGTASPANPVARLRGEIRVRLGNTNLPVAFAGLTPGFASLYQLNVTVPAGVPTGAEVPLVIERPDPNNALRFSGVPSRT
jgi:uncharacterized protein (TIGR03437 family)